MSSNVDYTPVILAQLTDMQIRLTKQDAVIAALKAEVERLSGRNIAANDTMLMSIPLRSHDNSGERGMRIGTPQISGGTKPVFGTGNGGANNNRPSFARGPSENGGMRSRPRVAPPTSTPVSTKSSGPHPTMNLTDILKKDEEVVMMVHTGKDESGNFVDTNIKAKFNGSELEVTECSMVGSLVGTKSGKPGEILYKFINELKSAGHIKKTFTIAPWKLCFVERNGVRQNLEQLRNNVVG